MNERIGHDKEYEKKMDVNDSIEEKKSVKKKEHETSSTTLRALSEPRDTFGDEGKTKEVNHTR